MTPPRSDDGPSKKTGKNAAKPTGKRKVVTASGSATKAGAGAVSSGSVAGDANPTNALAPGASPTEALAGVAAMTARSSGAAATPWATASSPVVEVPASGGSGAAVAVDEAAPIKPGARPASTSGSTSGSKTGSKTRSKPGPSAGPGPGAKKPLARGRKLPPRWAERLFARPNIDGPRVRFGLVWILFAAPAVYFGPVPTAALFGLHALIAALQSGLAWRRLGYRPSRLLAGSAAVALPVLAVNSYLAPGIVIIVLPLLALAAAAVVPRGRRHTSVFVAAGVTIRCALPAGVAAAGMVYTTRIGVDVALVFLALVTAYDIGSFSYGAEASSPVTGIFWGAAFTMGAMTPVFCLQLPPFDGSTAAWAFAFIVAVFASLGQVVASLCIPSAVTWVPALRRLDAYILAAPLWAWLMWQFPLGFG